MRLIRDIDHFLNAERLEARPDALWYSLRSFAIRRRVPLAFAAAVLIGAGPVVVGRCSSLPPCRRRPSRRRSSRPGVRSPCCPSRTRVPTPSLDFLRLALPDEIATILSHIRSVSVRPFATTSRYGEPTVDPQQAGREMRAGTVVTGHFLRAGDALRITLEAIDVESNRSLWRDTLDVPAGNLIATQTQIGLRVRGGLAAALGWPASTASAAPTDEEAYGLFLRTAALTLDPANNASRDPRAGAVGRSRSYLSAGVGGPGAPLLRREPLRVRRSKRHGPLRGRHGTSRPSSTPTTWRPRPGWSWVEPSEAIWSRRTDRPSNWCAVARTASMRTSC